MYDNLSILDDKIIDSTTPKASEASEDAPEQICITPLADSLATPECIDTLFDPITIELKANQHTPPIFLKPAKVEQDRTFELVRSFVLGYSHSHINDSDQLSTTSENPATKAFHEGCNAVMNKLSEELSMLRMDKLKEDLFKLGMDNLRKHGIEANTWDSGDLQQYLDRIPDNSKDIFASPPIKEDNRNSKKPSLSPKDGAYLQLPLPPIEVFSNKVISGYTADLSAFSQDSTIALSADKDTLTSESTAKTMSLDVSSIDQDNKITPRPRTVYAASKPPEEKSASTQKKISKNSRFKRLKSKFMACIFGTLPTDDVCEQRLPLSEMIVEEKVRQTATPTLPFTQESPSPEVYPEQEGISSVSNTYRTRIMQEKKSQQSAITLGI